jgi:hypothetical protein
MATKTKSRAVARISDGGTLAAGTMADGMRRRRRRRTTKAVVKTRRRPRRKPLADKMSANIMPLVIATAAATGSAILSNKFDVLPAKPRENALIKIAAGLAGGAYFLSQGNAPIGFGWACGLVAANIGQVVPQLAEGTMADNEQSMASWARNNVGDGNATYLDSAGNAMERRNGTNGFGLYYQNGQFAPAQVQTARFS